MENYFSKLDEIQTLEDIQKMSGNTEDGETDYLEFKSIRCDLSNRQNLGRAKSIIAKEICAFLNSGGGILCWGIEKDSDTGIIRVVNESNVNLEELFDSKLGGIIEPTYSEVRTKTISSKLGSFLVIAVNEGKHIPYRVSSWNHAESSISMRYYMRSGTKSESMPESIVRHLYQSRARVPDISATSFVDRVDATGVKIGVYVKPDKTSYVKDYYLGLGVSVIRNDYLTTPFLEPTSLIKNQEALYPANDGYKICDVNIRSNYGILMGELDTVYLSQSSMADMIGVILRTSIACDGVPLKTNYTICFLSHLQYKPCNEKCGKDDVAELAKRARVDILKQEGYDESTIDYEKLEEVMRKHKIFEQKTEETC